MDTIMQLLLILLCGWVQCDRVREALPQRNDGYTAYTSDFTQAYEPYVFAAVPLHPPMPVLHVISSKPLAPPKRDIYHASAKHRPTYVRHAFTNSEYTRPAYGGQSEYSRPLFTQLEYTRPSYAQSEYDRPSYTHSQYDRPPYVQPVYVRPFHSHSDYSQSSYTESDFPKTTYALSEYVRPTYSELYAESTYARPDSQISSAGTDFSASMHPKSLSHLAYAKRPSQGTLPHPTSQEPAPKILYARPTGQGGYLYSKEPTRKRHANARKKSPQKETPMIIRLHKHRVTRSR